jgi:hypothetical protein
MSMNARGKGKAITMNGIAALLILWMSLSLIGCAAPVSPGASRTTPVEISLTVKWVGEAKLATGNDIVKSKNALSGDKMTGACQDAWQVKEEPSASGEYTVSFLTAWSAPREAFSRKIAPEFPALTFRLRCEDPGMNEARDFLWRDGILVQEETGILTRK